MSDGLIDLLVKTKNQKQTHYIGGLWGLEIY
jgi:hypothetical protein